METVKINVEELRPNTGQIEGLPSNPRRWTKEEMDRLKNSINETPELLEARGAIVYPYAGKYIVLGGNMRLSAVKSLGWKEMPCVILPEGMPVDKLREIVIKDNGSFGEWDMDALANAWDDMPLSDWGAAITWDKASSDDAKTSCSSEREVREDDFHIIEEAETRVDFGDVWMLEEHRLVCGDSLDDAAYKKLLTEEQPALLLTDPPYGMKKEAEGIANDNLNFRDLLDFNKKWIECVMEHLHPVGSFYCFGIDEVLMDIYSEIIKPMERERRVTFRNLITWWKGEGGQSVGTDMARSYSRHSEKILFFSNGVIAGKTRDLSTWYEPFESIRGYIEGELKKAGLTIKQMCAITSSYAGHYVSRSQWAFPTEKDYKAIQDYCRCKDYDVFRKDYDELRKDYDELRKDYDELRKDYLSKQAYFDATICKKNDVWHIPAVSVKEKSEGFSHARVKPQELLKIPILTSSREGEIVLDCFGGSGSTLIACEQLGRRCRMIELEPRWCDVIIARWEKFTGKKAEKIG